MRTTEEVNKGLHIYFTERGRIYAVQDNYSHTLKRIKETLEYLKIKGITIPDDGEIAIETLGGEMYNGVMSIEFSSVTLPVEDKKQIYKLTDGSGLWKWLVKN